MQNHHLTYRPRFAAKAAVLALLAAAISLLLTAPAQAQDPIGATAAAQNALDQVQATLAGASGTPTEVPSAAAVQSGGGAAAAPADDKGPAAQLSPVAVPAGGEGGEQDLAPTAGAVVADRPGVVRGVEKTLEPVVRSGQTAVREAAATLKQAQADANASVNTPATSAAAKRGDAGASRAPSAATASAAAARRAGGAAGTAAIGSVPSASTTGRTPQTDGIGGRFRQGDLAAQAGPAAGAARVDAARSTQRTDAGGSAGASTGTGAAVAAILLALLILAGATLRTRVPSSPAMSPALGFTSLLERPG